MLCLVLTGSISFAQNNTASEYQVKAVFLFNFTQFIDWPATAFRSPDDPFVIGIFGENPFGTYLDEVVAGEKIGTHPILVKYYEEIKDIANCHILYINSGDPLRVGRILSAVSQKNTLTVSDASDFSKLGGIVRFYTENSKIRLEINVERSKAVQLNISSKLLGVAKTN